MTEQAINEANAKVVVGIGASAGGVEALGLFFDAERGHSGAAFVVVMHLSSTRTSHLPDILARHTTMRVVSAEDGATLAPNAVHVMPPGVVMTISNGRLKLEKAASSDRIPTVIDRFFNSLAEQYAEHAIGIVLSGTGADGALGLKVIKERGGLTIAQGEDGTVPLFSGMPDSAIATGAVDIQLSVEDMGPRLLSVIASLHADPTLDEVDDDRTRRLRLQIAGLLHERINHDFSGYKPSTFLRRVQRRREVLQLPDLEGYVEYFRRTPGEAQLLFRDLLISVTSFFRDPGAFEALEKQVIPELFKGKGAKDEVRVWVTGCATGEEAYSIAILLREHAEKLGGDSPYLRIFATDIDERALIIARRGTYPAVLVEAVSEERRERFFTESAGAWTVQKHLRETCTFSPHNALRDPPFSRLDLVSCRNLLIYLGPEFQDRILPIVHYALRDGGFLFVGVAEGASRHGSIFSTLSKEHRIFRKLPAAPGQVMVPRLASTDSPRLQAPFVSSAAQSSSNGLRRQIEAHLLQRHSPPYVLVNAQGDALYYSGRTGPYLEFSPGAPSRYLLSNARKELRLGLRRALHDAVTTQTRVSAAAVDLPHEQAGAARRIQLTVEPFADGENPLYLVLFHDHGIVPDRASELDPDTNHTVDHLERELRDTRDQLQSTYEEFETAIEELRVANEELMSVNEELQSSNEELETSKEELQSVNEEMQTINSEMSRSVDALDQSNADLRGLLESTGIATIFLDRDLSIRRYTQAATEIFTLIPSDCGRMITDLNHQLTDLNLGESLRESQVNRRPVQQPVSGKDGNKHFLMCLLPYKGSTDETGGVVMTFVDVTPMAEAEARQQVMIGELNHRVRNMLAVVNAMANQTLGPVVDEDILDPFLSRLHAMARTYKLLTESGWSHMVLKQMLQEELSVASGSNRYLLTGPKVMLDPRESLAVGMVIHELTTNAVKYGALANGTGRVEVSWSCDPRTGAVDLQWIERGGLPVSPPTRRGFGTLLIERQLSYELDGTTELDYAPEGLAAHLCVPRLQKNQSESQP